MVDMNLLWVANSILLGVGIFFIKLWFGRLRDDLIELKTELRLKADKATCDRIHVGVDRLLHTHAQTGDCGEVVK
jgi:hypothetical protein